MDSFSLSKLTRYGTININVLDPSKSVINIKDTAGLINYLFKTVLFDGYKAGKIVPPKKASSILGKEQHSFILIILSYGAGEKSCNLSISSTRNEGHIIECDEASSIIFHFTRRWKY
jgi:hypothetical protein